MPSRKQTEIFSVFGQIDAVAAEIMIEAGKIKRINVRDFPRGAPVIDEHGRHVRFGIVVPARHRRELEKLTADLYA